MSHDWLAEKYELVGLAGQGGMATVWHGVTHGASGFTRRVAIKRLQPALARNAEFAAMFVEEARIVADLMHPNIVQVYDFCQDREGTYFIVMEWIEGVHLGQVMTAYRRKGHALPWQPVLQVAAGVLRGLASAHHRPGAPVFHRDVTPANILLSVHGEAKIADFGLARAMDRMTMTSPGVIKGKLAYVAPELLAGVRATAGSDVYSLGVVVWEALAGRRLFQGKNPVELFVQVGQAKVPPLDEVREDLPARVAKVVGRLTARLPKERFADAVVAAEALEELLGGPTDALRELVRVTREAGELLSSTPPAG